MGLGRGSQLKVDPMESSYVGRKIDLFLLSEWVETFFAERGFRVAKDAGIKGYRVVARPTHVHEIIGRITVSISGNPDDFTVKFFAGSQSDSFLKYGRLTSLFGGGILYLRGVRSKEAEERLERSFWVFIEQKMNSAQPVSYRPLSEEE